MAQQPFVKVFIKFKLDKQLKYRADIDGLRSIAILSVVGFHYFPHLVKGGFVGVDIFFVISGFLISTIIFEGIKINKFDVLEFYSRRVRRIFPALIIVMLTCLLLGSITLMPDEYILLGKHIAAGATFSSNYILLGESGYFDVSADTKILLHLWSLALEEQFYLIWPILVWGAYKLKVDWLILIVVTTVISFVLNCLAINVNPAADFFSPQTRFWELLIGSLLAYCFTVGTYKDKFESSKFKNLLSITGLVLIVFSLIFFTRKIAFPGTWALVPVVGSLCIIGSGPNSWVNVRLLSTRALVWLGVISYPLYLWHWPLLTFSRILESGTPSLLIRSAALLLSVILSWVTYKLIERPIRSGNVSLKKTLLLLVTMLATGVAGYLVYKSDGAIFRSSRLVSQKKEQQFQEDCSLRFKNIPATHCAEIRSGKDIALIVGDSHVRHWFEILKVNLLQDDFDAVAISKGGCPFLLNTKVPNVPECIDANNEIFSFILENQNKIKLILLAGEYSTYSSYDYLKDAKGKVVAFGDALDTTIAKLPKDIKVVILEQVPPINFDPKKCVYRQFRLSKNKFVCNTSRKNINESLAPYKKQESYVLSKYSNVSSFDVDNILCTPKVCNAKHDGWLMYFDKTHLNEIGVNFVRSNLQFDKPIKPTVSIRESEGLK